MKHLKLVLCLAALGNLLTGPFLGFSYSAMRLSMPFAAFMARPRRHCPGIACA